MISISTLYCGSVLPSHQLRYGRSAEKKPGPVVVYNCTARCNLGCVHCYSASAGQDGQTELTTAEAKAMLDDLAALGVPVVLFSGGEPTLREDLPELAAHAAGAGVRSVVSSNGTLISPEMARTLAEAGVGYVGVSIDGLKAAHDAFRRCDGAFESALAGIANCQAAGVRVGLRMTLTARNVGELADVFELIRGRNIPRVCFYHLVYTGRGRELQGDDLPAQRRRDALDLIMDRAAALHAAGREVEVLTVDNHADGPYVVLRLLRESPPRAVEAMRLLRANGGNASGVRLACIRPNGDVLPDQFWHARVLGNVRERRFSDIWDDESIELLADLRRRPRPLTGRCARCRWLDVCNGNFRARAEAATGDLWADDPACYLTDEEVRGYR